MISKLVSVEWQIQKFLFMPVLRGLSGLQKIKSLSISRR
jgi:hypothetical protein